MTREEFTRMKKIEDNLQKIYRRDKARTRNMDIGQYLLDNVFTNDTLEKRVSNDEMRNIRGFCCEFYLKEVLTDYLKKNRKKGKVLTNLLIPTDRGTSQLDVLYLSEYSMICIECKSLFGYISVENEVITSEANYGKTSITPWKQNIGHIMAVKSILRKQNIHSSLENLVFIFSIGKIDKCKLKENNYFAIPSNIINVVHGLDMLNERDNGKRFNPTALYNTLKIYTPTKEEEFEHIKRVSR